MGELDPTNPNTCIHCKQAGIPCILNTYLNLGEQGKSLLQVYYEALLNGSDPVIFIYPNEGVPEITISMLQAWLECRQSE